LVLSEAIKFNQAWLSFRFGATAQDAPWVIINDDSFSTPKNVDY